MPEALINIPYRIRLLVLAVTTVVVLGLVNVQIAGKEAIIANGQVVLLRLAPQDPRSLLQGDYMALRYRMADAVAQAAQSAQISDGLAVIRQDEYGVAAFDRLHDGQQLAGDEHVLRFRKRGDSVRLASDAYFFEEGEWQTYQGAVYGELAVADDGEAVLTGLRDGELQRLGPLFDR